MHLSAQQKQQYLDAMGIQPWYPRVRLNLAPEPFVFGSSVETGSETASSVAAIEPATAQPRAAEQPAALASQTPPPSIATEAPSAEPVPASTEPRPSANVKPIHFGLGLYVLGPWLIVSSLSAQHNAQQDPAFRLLIAILRQFGNQDEEPSYHHVIAWPFFSNPNADQGKLAANQYVNGVIEHLVEEHPVRRVLVFGGVLAKLNDWDSPEGDCISLPRMNLPSLYKMLKDPSQKAKAWQLIQDSSLYQA